MSQAQILVKTANPSLRGNAVIGMKVEGERDYRWSWHVWVTDTGVLTEASLGEVDVLSVILGSHYNESENKDFGLLYQWGRKDPFPNPVNGQPQLYGKTDGENPSVKIEEVSEENNIQNAIRNPLVFYTSNRSPYDWSTTVASKQDAQLWRDMDGFKSIYDPCPYGWRVASKEDLPAPISYFSWGNGDVQTLIQELVGQVYYPCAGYQDGQSGALQGQNSELCYWTSSKGAPQAYGMYGKWDEYNLGGQADIDYRLTNRANGYSVRCVRNN